MKILFYNIGYFLSEAKRTVCFNPLSNFFSLLGTGLILFLFGLVLTGWSVGDRLINALQKEAEVSAYFSESTDKKQALALVDLIKAKKGVLEASYIDATEAYEQSKEMLGNEADILKLFDENPFEAYIDIRIELKDMDAVLAEINNLDGIEYVRDNREVLSQLKGIVDALKLLGILIALAVGVTTLIIISHMIRQGIYNNKEQINTLRLLGAPDGFIGFPFILAGTFLTMMGGLLASSLIIVLLNHGYSQLSGYLMFLPMPPMTELRSFVSLAVISVSAALGLLGSLFGVSSIRKSN